MDDADFADLIERARGGDEAAAGRLVREFEPEIRAMVRARLPRTLRSQYDSLDFVQNTLASFFHDLRDGRGEFGTAQHLKAFLSGMVKNKVFEEHRRRTRTRKYDIGREEQLYVRKGDREVAREVAGTDPTPSQEVQGQETRDRLAALGGPIGARIVEMRLQDLSYVEIARRLNVDERTVRRHVTEMRARLESRPWR